MSREKNGRLSMLQRRYRRGGGLRTWLTLIMLFPVIVISVIYAVVVYRELTDITFHEIDHKLLVAADLAKSTLPDNYHDIIHNIDSVPPPRYERLVAKFDQICERHQLEYVWSLMLIEGEVRFTTGSSVDKKTHENHAGFFELHSNPGAYSEAFSSLQMQYTSIDDKWGDLRTVLVPALNKKGQPYLFGASVRTDYVDALQEEHIERSARISLVLMLIGAIGSWFFAAFITRILSAMTNQSRNVAEGHYDQQITPSGPREIRALGANLNAMSEQIRRTIQDLKVANKNLDTTLNSIGDGVIVTDGDGMITRMNPVAEAITGWDADTAREKPLTKVFNIINARTRRPCVNPVEKVFESGKIVDLANHTALIRRDGSEVQIADSGAPIRNERGEISGVVLVFRDVTESYRLQQQLHERRFIVESSNAMIVTANLEGDLVYANPAFLTAWGFDTIAEIAGRSILEFWVIEDGHSELTGALIGSGTWNGYAKAKRKDNSLFDTQMSVATVRNDEGNPIARMASCVDVTEERQLMADLLESRQKLALHVEQTPLAVIEWNLNFEVADWNPGAERVFGYRREEALGRHASFIVSSEYRTHVDDIWQSLLVHQGGNRSTNDNVTKENQTIKCEWYNTPLVDDSGNTIGAASLVMDISDRQHLEDQLRQSQKMEAVGQLAGGIAHDFNNLLTAILGYAEVIQLDLKDTDSLAENVGSITAAAKRAASLTRQLLTFSRKQVLQPQILELNRVVTDVENMMRRLIGEHIDLVTIKSGEVGCVEADPAQLEQVLINLAVNARDAMPNGGKLIIETSNTDLDDNYVKDHLGAEPGSFVMLAVTDTGTGMDADTRSKAFDPFFTTKDPGKGTGLGLSTVYGIVKQAGGSIWCYSELGKGTAFKVYLPRVADSVDELVQESASMDLPRGSELILVVEDEIHVRRTTRLMLEKTGYRVTDACNGEEALKICQAATTPFDLVITDVIMPGMSGTDLVKILADICPDTAVLFISGYTDNAIVRQGAMEQGAAFLQKPFSISELCRKVRDLLNANGT
jgi:PAS domain S-box-containing protein